MCPIWKRNELCPELQWTILIHMNWTLQHQGLVEMGLRFSGSFIEAWKRLLHTPTPPGSQCFTPDKGHLHLSVAKKYRMKYQLVLQTCGNLGWVELNFFPYNDFSTIQISRPNRIFAPSYPPKIFHHPVTICNVLFQLIVNYFQISDQVTVYKTITARQFAFLSSHLFSKTRAFGWPSASYFKPVYFCWYLMSRSVSCESSIKD